MRKLAISFALISVLAAAACSDNPYDPDGPAVDPNAPRVHITSPERGAFAGDVATLEVKGNASDDTGVASVTVNGVNATVAPDGSWTARVPVAAGTNLLHAIATDAQGNTGKETRAVVAGPTVSIDRVVGQAITASMSTQTFDAIGRGAGNFITTSNLGALVQPMNPVLDLGTTNGQPDCLYAQGRITSMSVAAADVKLIPQTGGLGLDVTLDGVSVGMYLQYAAACIDGSRNVTAKAQRLRVRGKLAVSLDNLGRFKIALQNPNVQLVGLDVDLGGIPGAIVDLLSLDTRLGPVLAWATERFVVPMLNNSLQSLTQTKTVNVLGKAIDITVHPSRVEFDVTGALVELDTVLRAHGDEGSPGYVYVENVVPAMDKSQGFQLAVADDAANQLLGSFWAAKGMELALDLKTGPYGEIGKLYDRVELAARVPPFIDASGKGLVLTIGDLMATFRDKNSVATQIAINATLKLEVVTKADGSLRFDVGTPKVFVDILDEYIDGANQLSNAQFEAVTSFALSRIVAFGSGAVGAIPMPSIGGVSMTNVSIAEQHGYLVVDGEIQ
ncbi:MAG: hypothetical protein KF773_25800 [Deltaproteobacteria bacterium]|nr:hypothetical protein [Deltaproteobacteria bacterium]